jgi:hypothetical protein
MKSIGEDSYGIGPKDEKDCWLLLSLQKLPPSKFIRVVGNILKGRYLLISSDFSSSKKDQHEIH